MAVRFARMRLLAVRFIVAVRDDLRGRRGVARRTAGHRPGPDRPGLPLAGCGPLSRHTVARLHQLPSRTQAPPCAVRNVSLAVPPPQPDNASRTRLAARLALLRT